MSILDSGQAVAEFRRGDYGNRYTVAACGATEVGVLSLLSIKAAKACGQGRLRWV